MLPGRTSLLLTGATGLLGHYVLAELLRVPGVRCRVLLRSPVIESRERVNTLLAALSWDLDELIADGRVVPVEGELPDRVPPEAWHEVDAVIHAAASTAFDPDATGEPTRTNVDGTRALLDAAAASGVKHFVFVSTAYVCGRRTGVVRECVTAQAPEFCNAYERSKWEAEQLVWAWRSDGRACTICRPSILFGDSATGRTTAYGGIYLIARATEILRRAVLDDPSLDPHRIPLRILGHADATSDLVPVDCVARQIASAAVESSGRSRVIHMTNPDPPSHADIKRWLEAHFDIAGGTFCDRTGPLDDPNHYEALFYSLGNVVSDYFRRGLSFASTADAPAEDGARLVDKEAFLRSLRYAQSQGWGRAARSSRPRVPADDQVDPRWYFEEFLPLTIPRSSVARVHALTAAIRFMIGSPPAEWVCRFDRGRLLGVSGGVNEPAASFGFRVGIDAFTQLVTGRRPLQVAFFRGEADLVGHVEQALRMVPIMSAFVKEFPVAHG